MKNKSQHYKTLVFGASTKNYRYSYRAVNILKLNGYDVVPIGLTEGQIQGIDILTGHPDVQNVHTITMYVNAERQKEHYHYLIGLNPKRIIFNPGTENPELERMASLKGIYCENACTLVLLSLGQYEDFEQEHSKSINNPTL